MLVTPVSGVIVVVMSRRVLQYNEPNDIIIAVLNSAWSF